MSTEKSTKQKIKDYFLSGKKLTSCGAAKEFLTADLRKIISVLRSEGLDIGDKVITSGSGKRYKEYWIKTEADKQAEQAEAEKAKTKAAEENIKAKTEAAAPAPVAETTSHPHLDIVYPLQPGAANKGHQQSLF